jgi:hypothetical protein
MSKNFKNIFFRPTVTHLFLWNYYAEFNCILVINSQQELRNQGVDIDMNMMCIYLNEKVKK